MTWDSEGDEDSDAEIIIEDVDDIPLHNSPMFGDVPEVTLDFIPGVNLYSTLFPDSPATVNGSEIRLTLSRDFLPLSMQSIYGYLVSDALVEITIALTLGNWHLRPTKLNVVHPRYGIRYIGQPLVQNVLNDFFTASYRPKPRYRSASYLITPTRVIRDPRKIASMTKLGFSQSRATHALALCQEDVQRAIDFLKTGHASVSAAPVPFTWDECPLLFLVFEIAEAFLSLTDHCCTCGVSIRPGLKPSICGAELCQFQLSEIGIGTSVHQEMKRDPVVADLLISLFAASLEFTRAVEVPGLKADFPAILGRLPPVRGMVSGAVDDRSLKHSIGDDAFRLLRWVLLSCQSHLISVPDHLRFGQFACGAQFMTLLANPHAEERFNALKKQYGSCFLWHGSAGSRWHAILRDGLKNASGTDLQVNGASLGRGIYLARNSDVSWGYSRTSGNLYRGSQLGQTIHAIALCEVAKVPSLADKDWAHVLGDEEAVIVRFLFVTPEQKLNQAGGGRMGLFGRGSRASRMPGFGMGMGMGMPMWNIDVLAEPPTGIPTLWDILDLHAARKE
jgi:poly [ADP-ribose] polymerase 6/8